MFVELMTISRAAADAEHTWGHVYSLCALASQHAQECKLHPHNITIVSESALCMHSEEDKRERERERERERGRERRNFGSPMLSAKNGVSSH